MQEPQTLSFWRLIAEYPLFVLRLFTYPRSVVRSLDWEDGETRTRLALYLLLSLGIIVLAFHDNRVLAAEAKPLLSTFKGVVMRAHLRSWDWLSPVYGVFHLGQSEAMRLWDTLLTAGFLAYTMFASLIGVAVVARIRMQRFGLSWNHAIGTAATGHICAVGCIALSLVPLMELLICRECIVRLTLFVLLNFMGWTYMGFYTLADLGERPQSPVRHLFRAMGYGLLQYLVAYLVFFILIVAIIPI